jgi:formate-dependent nitrite reductase membrane component NrfD
MVRYTPQREWIERRGVLMWLAMFFIELGAGAFAVGSVLDSQVAMLVGWLLCGVLGGGLHLLYLGKPMRFWRMVLSSGWKTSWISRGLAFVVTFLGLGLIHMVLAQWASSPLALMIAADVFAVLAVIYAGFVMASVNGIALWNTPLLPVLYLVLGVWGGLGISLLTITASGSSGDASVEQWSRIFLVAFIFIVAVYLISIRYQGAAGKASVQTIIAGKMAPIFWIGVALVGTAFPAAMALATWAAGLSMPSALLFVLIAFELAGDLTLRYCILKAGLYAPLIPSRPS